MTDKYANLRARLAALKLGGPVSTDPGKWNAATDALDVELVAELLAERDAMRADAQRYRWLRNEAVQFGYDDGRMSAWAVVGTHYAAFNPIQGDELDAAIDAALKGAAP